MKCKISNSTERKEYGKYGNFKDYLLSFASTAKRSQEFIDAEMTTLPKMARWPSFQRLICKNG